MGRLLSAKSGVVTSRNGRHYTILLTNGTTVKFHADTTGLSLGDECQVLYDYTRNRVKSVMCNEMVVADMSDDVEPPEQEEINKG